MTLDKDVMPVFHNIGSWFSARASFIGKQVTKDPGIK